MDLDELGTQLGELNGNVEQVLAQQKRFDEKLGEVEQTRADVEKRLTKHDETLSTHAEWQEEIQRDATKERFNAGGVAAGSGFCEADALLNIMDEGDKRWIDRVRALHGGGLVTLSDAGPVNRSSACARMAQKDPIAYVATGLWFQARMKQTLAGQTGRVSESTAWREKAEKLEKALGGIVSKADLGEDTDATGGFLVPTITEAMIGWIIKDASVVRSAGATVMQMTAKTHELPTLANDFSVAWKGEAATITDSAPSSPFGQGNLTAEKLTGLVTVSVELIQDNIINLMDFLMTHLLNLVGREEDVQALEGTGSPHTGLFSVSGTTDVAGGDNALTAPEISKLIYGGEEQSTITGGVIWGHPFIARDVIGLALGASAVFLPFAVSSSITPTNLYGVPFYGTAAISRVRNVDNTTAYHGNPAYLVIGDRMGTTFDVNPWSETEFKDGQILLRLMRRTAILVWVPGYFTKLTAVVVLP